MQTTSSIFYDDNRYEMSAFNDTFKIGHKRVKKKKKKKK